MFKLNLKNVEWGEFFIGGEEGIFKISGTTTTHPSLLIIDGDIPRVTCSATNNGVEGFYKNKSTEKGGVLTVDSATIGFVSYQGSDFIATDHVEKIEKKDGTIISKNVGLFLKTVIEKATKGKYGYGYKFSQTRIKRQKIMLPIDEKGNPNWEFMENYIEERKNKKIEKLKKYYENKLSDLIIENKNLKNVEWGEFYISDIFKKIQRGKRLTKTNQKEGEMPYISSTSLNNGVDNFIGNTENVRIFNNNLTLANSGSLGAVFYHNYEYIASDHVTSLSLKRNNKYHYFFIGTILKRIKEKYCFNREISDKRLKREKIILPIDEKGNPNWEFMENYIKIIEKKKIEKILKRI